MTPRFTGDGRGDNCPPPASPPPADAAHTSPRPPRAGEGGRGRPRTGLPAPSPLGQGMSDAQGTAPSALSSPPALAALTWPGGRWRLRPARVATPRCERGAGWLGPCSPGQLVARPAVPAPRMRVYIRSGRGTPRSGRARGAEAGRSHRRAEGGERLPAQSCLLSPPPASPEGTPGPGPATRTLPRPRRCSAPEPGPGRGAARRAPQALPVLGHLAGEGAAAGRGFGEDRTGQCVESGVRRTAGGGPHLDGGGRGAGALRFSGRGLADSLGKLGGLRWGQVVVGSVRRERGGPSGAEEGENSEGVGREEWIYLRGT